MRRALILILLACAIVAGGASLLGALDACVPADTRPVPGSLTVNVSPSPAVVNGVVTVDGWTIGFERVLVGIGGVRLGDSCLSYSEASYDRVLDMRSKDNQKLSITYAIGQCDFRFRIQPPSSDALLGEGVTQDQKDVMRTPGADPYVPRGGIAFSVAGAATRGGVTKRFELLFRPRVRYQNCQLVPDSGLPPVDLPSESTLVYDIRIEAEAMLRDDVDAAAPLRFDPFAAADKDGDGVVTLDELRQVPIATVRDGGAFEAGTYEFDDDAGLIRAGRPLVITSFGDYVYEVLLPSIPRFRDTGGCTIGLGGRGGLGNDASVPPTPN
jgi:hypothetical protein